MTSIRDISHTIYWVHMDTDSWRNDMMLFGSQGEQEGYLWGIIAASWPLIFDYPAPIDLFEALSQLKESKWGDRNWLTWDEQVVKIGQEEIA